MGVTIPETYGGQKRGFLDTALVVDELMRTLGEAISVRSLIDMDTSSISLHEREHARNRSRSWSMPDFRYRRAIMVKGMLLTINLCICYDFTLSSMGTVPWRLMQYGTTRAVWEKAI